MGVAGECSCALQAQNIPDAAPMIPQVAESELFSRRSTVVLPFTPLLRYVALDYKSYNTNIQKPAHDISATTLHFQLTPLRSPFSDSLLPWIRHKKPNSPVDLSKKKDPPNPTDLTSDFHFKGISEATRSGDPGDPGGWRFTISTHSLASSVRLPSASTKVKGSPTACSHKGRLSTSTIRLRATGKDTHCFPMEKNEQSSGIDEKYWWF